jgi:acetyl-CoA acetyltransferase
MAWYVSYRKSGHTVMRVFDSRGKAVEAAWQALDLGHKSALRVGPMEGMADKELGVRDLIRLRTAAVATSDTEGRPL